MTEIPLNRTCVKAGIAADRCACSPLEEIDLTASKSNVKDKRTRQIRATAANAAKAFVETVNYALKDVKDVCHDEWKLKRIVRAKWMRVVNGGGGGSSVGSSTKDDVKLLLRLQLAAVDGSAAAVVNDVTTTFDVWVSTNKRKSAFSFIVKLSEASRVEMNGDSTYDSSCVSQRAERLAKFCICR